MSENWENLKHQQERVKWARMNWRAIDNTARAAAASLGMKETTYQQYERHPDSSRSAKLDVNLAKTFGRKFKVSWVWLLSGEGTPFSDEIPEPILRITNALKEVTPEQQEAAAEIIEKL